MITHRENQVASWTKVVLVCYYTGRRFIVSPAEKLFLRQTRRPLSIASVIDNLIVHGRSEIERQSHGGRSARSRATSGIRVPPVTEMVRWAACGPQKYTGKSMAASHRDLKITSEEWKAFLDFQHALDKFKVPGKKQADFRAPLAGAPRIGVKVPPMKRKQADGLSPHRRHHHPKRRTGPT